MKLGIDPGKFRTKAVTKVNDEWRYFDVRSKITVNPRDIIPGENYLLKYNNIEYLIGEGANDYSLDTDKQSIQHKLCTYLAIDQLAGNEDCKIVLGFPFNLFKNASKREEYENYINTKNYIKLHVNDEEKYINIIDAASFPECGGIAYSEPDEDFENKIRAVLDIGGLNINGCVFENLNPISESIITENLGSLILMNDIKTELNKEFPEINLQDYEIPEILKIGLQIDGKKMEKANKIICGTVEEHFSKIVRVMKKKNWSVKTLPITAGGGGSLDIGINLIRNFIAQTKLCLDPVWGNAKGFYEVAEMLF